MRNSISIEISEEETTIGKRLLIRIPIQEPVTTTMTRNFLLVLVLVLVVVLDLLAVKKNEHEGRRRGRL